MSRRTAYTIRMSVEEQQKLSPLIDAAARILHISKHEFVLKSIVASLNNLDNKLKELRNKEQQQDEQPNQ